MRALYRAFLGVIFGSGLMLFAQAGPAGAATVDVDSTTSLSATAASSLTPLTGAGDTKNDSDNGSLVKPDVSASALANLASEGDVPDRSANGTSSASLTHDSGSFDLSGGTTAAILPDSAFGGSAQAQAVASVLLPFSLDTTADQSLNYQFTIDTLVLKNEKITLLLDRTGNNPASLFNQVFDSSASGAIPNLASGTYRLQLIAGSTATNLGVQGEHGSARFDVSLDTGGGGVVIPLPNPLASGAIALACVFGGLLVFRRRIVG